MRLIAYKMATDFESDTSREDSSHKKQMPSYASQLTKLMLFTKKGPTEEK